MGPKCFQMTVERNNATAIATPCDRPKSLAPVFQSTRRKTNNLSKRNFSRALSKLQVIAKSFDWFIALFAPAVIGRGNYFGICFSTVI